MGASWVSGCSAPSQRSPCFFVKYLYHYWHWGFSLTHCNTMRKMLVKMGGKGNSKIVQSICKPILSRLLRIVSNRIVFISNISFEPIASQSVRRRNLNLIHFNFHRPTPTFGCPYRQVRILHGDQIKLTWHWWYYDVSLALAVWSNETKG
jgi:hypothetical protein